MMIPERPTLERRVLAALDGSTGSGPRIPVVLGGCGSGRTSLLLRLRDLIGRTQAQYVDVERIATTPERFFQALRESSPFPALPYGQGQGSEPGARDAFDALLAVLDTARAPGGAPATFLLDEFLELRTFESFPGLRRVLHDCLDGLTASGNRFVLTSRYVARTLRLLRDHSARFEVIHMPALTTEDTSDILGPTAAPGGGDNDPHDAEYLARTVQALADGRPVYVSALADELAALREHGAPGGGDAISALAGLLATGGRLAAHCEFSYELRLHRARGYGALKAILEILADEEGLTLTEISVRLQRTPGSTKDYLSWLEDVDLVTSRQKRYSFTDPLLRVWVRLHCRPSAPTEDDLAREVHRYALPRLPQQTDAPATPATTEPAFAMAGPGSGIIEID
jgi:hypothetical protein